tara:strand:- start:111 stop:374 length:264 start_codon:yes stop_codon:yes gene_type:complete
MPQAHIAYRVESNTLINNPEIVLQRMSFKIMEKRDQILENLIGTKVQFKTNGNGGIEQGVVQSVNNQQCSIKVGNSIAKISVKKLII